MTLTPELFDALIILVILIGLALAAVRLYADFTRPLPADNAPYDPYALDDDDTEPNRPRDVEG